jgi:hypothetical protein
LAATSDFTVDVKFRVTFAVAQRFAFATVKALRSVMLLPKKKPPEGGLWGCSMWVAVLVLLDQ